MFGALAARGLGVHDRQVLEDVEMPPPPLGLVIVEAAALCALRATPARRAGVSEVHVHLAFFKP